MASWIISVDLECLEFLELSSATLPMQVGRVKPDTSENVGESVIPSS
jgi:hypothetical protein